MEDYLAEYSPKTSHPIAKVKKSEEVMIEESKFKLASDITRDNLIIYTKSQFIAPIPSKRQTDTVFLLPSKLIRLLFLAPKLCECAMFLIGNW